MHLRAALVRPVALALGLVLIFASVSAQAAHADPAAITSGSVSITGNARPGNVLTAVPGTWTPANVTFTYQWQRDGLPVAGATASQFTVTTADLGHALAVMIFGAADGYATNSAISSAVLVTQDAIVPGPVTIAGTPQVGQELTAKWGTWTPGSVALEFQWLRNGTAITAATFANYFPTKDDIGAQISVRITGSAPTYATVVVTSAPTAAVTAAPAITAGTPTITGVTRASGTLTAVPGSWLPANTTFTYQWQRDGQPLAGATAQTLTLTADDIGHWFVVEVTGHASGYPDKVAYSSPSPFVTAAAISAGTVTITGGDPMVGRELKVNWGVWTPDGVSIDLQWLRNGTPISGATFRNYFPTKDDIGARISVRVTGSKTGYPPVVAASAETTAVGLDLYTTPGNWTVNGRQWRTACQKYSQTQRCRTEIWATTVTQVKGKFVQSNGWVFNNLTYLPLPEAAWAGNPLGNTGVFASAGHQWRTECHKVSTGNGCRSYVYSRVIVASANKTGGYSYSWQYRWVLNNIVQFTTPQVNP